MTSKEIIVKLIDEHLIDGEQAYVLINDIVQAEMVATMKLLKDDSNSTKLTVVPSWIHDSYTTAYTGGSSSVSSK